MSKDFSATKSQKTGSSATGSTPFDAIIALEEQEKSRVQKELDAMQEAEKAMQQTCEKKEAEAEQELKNAAKEDLKQYKEKELSPILKEGDKQSAAHCNKLDELYASKSEEFAKNLAEKLTDSDSLLVS